MTPVRFPVYRGAAPTLRFTLSPVVPAGIAGWTTRFTARRKASDADPLALNLAGTVNDATLCIVDVPITKAQTLSLIAGNYDVTLMRTDAGAEDVLAAGIMTVLLDVLDAKA